MTTLTFGDSRRLYGAVPPFNRKTRLRLLAVYCQYRRWAIDRLLRALTAASRIYHTIRYRAARKYHGRFARVNFPGERQGR